MRKMWLIVGLVLVVLVGLYFYAPSMFSGGAGANITPKFIGAPSLPSGAVVTVWVDGQERPDLADFNGHFTVSVGASHNFHMRVVSGGVTSWEINQMFVVPDKAGDYELVINWASHAIVELTPQ